MFDWVICRPPFHLHLKKTVTKEVDVLRINKLKRFISRYYFLKREFLIKHEM